MSKVLPTPRLLSTVVPELRVKPPERVSMRSRIKSVSLFTGNGRAIFLVAWLWPFTTLLFVVQAVYALGRRLVTPLLGFPLLVYNVIIATVAVTKFVIARTPSTGCAEDGSGANTRPLTSR